MVFCGIPFLFYFLPMFLLLYYILPFKMKNWCLLIFSIIFYAYGEPIYVFLVIISSIVDYTNARLLESFSNNIKLRKCCLIISIIINLSLLGIFKYSGLMIDTLNHLLNFNIKNPNLPLPIGISFFTFQTMSYSIDVYRHKVKAEKNFFTYMTYVAMFPQLIAGPIVRYETVSIELYTRKISLDNVTTGFYRFLIGLFKKVLIANNIGMLWDSILNKVTPLDSYGLTFNSAAYKLYESSTQISVACAWLGALAFSLQIYFDFSGYSDMAIGLGKMLGFTYPENFNYPYIADSITSFWRRWHMTLSSWFKDYVYIPLGGNRCKTFKCILNLLIVWSLTGLWHGASYNYLLWGIYFGILLIIEKYLLKDIHKKIPKFIRHLVTIILLLFSWIIFAIEDFNVLKDYILIMFGIAKTPFINDLTILYIKEYMLIILIGIICSIPIKEYFTKICKTNKLCLNLLSYVKLAFCILLLIISIACLVNDSYNPFLYFRF